MQRLFEAHPCLEGYEVIDCSTGRPVSRPRPTRQSANGIAQTLNRAAATGTLSRELRAA